MTQTELTQTELTDRIRNIKNTINGLSEFELKALSDILSNQKAFSDAAIKSGAAINDDKRTVNDAVLYVSSLKDIKKSLSINKERRQKINGQKNIVKFLLGKNFSKYEDINKVASKLGLVQYIESFEHKNGNTLYRLHSAFPLNTEYKPISSYIEQLPSYNEGISRRAILEDFESRLNSRLNLISIQDKQIRMGTFKVSELQILTQKQIEDSL